MQSQKYISLALTSIDIIFILLILLILLISCSLFHKAFAASPAFDQIFITDEETSNQRNDWVQTYGNDSTHLRSDHTNLLAVDYLSDGKTLDTTFWLASNLENASTYSQPLKRIRYGMLIAIVSLPPTSGYNGANYNFYIEAVDGKWSEYLYQLSSTGSSALIESKINYTEPFAGSTIGPGYAKLRLNLSSINYPTAYGLSFYTAESYKSNEVRDFTSWIAIPPATVDILTHPEKIVIRQGEKHVIPAEIDTPFSNNVTSITFDNGTDFSSDGLNVSIQRIHPPLFEVEVSPQTPVGAYTIPFVASMLIATTYSTSPTTTAATATVDTVTGVIDPEFQVSKKYPTIGYITSQANLTIDVIPPLTVNETFMAIWDTYATHIAIVVSGMVGVLMTFFVEHLRSRREHRNRNLNN
ncbi:MAG: hypothetical protein GEU26_18620 [Nitrososphaeraceae archaeon]|nr:hypothetical protein [Nitrososphaeraceae archaeon]